MTATITIGKSPAGPATFDLRALKRTGLLLQANSGGGKSWAMRRLAEQLQPRMPVVVIDWEGEFFSLREKFPFVLVGPGGEAAADTRSAALLARRILQNGLSWVCDLSEMPPNQRVMWMASFSTSLNTAPRSEWRELAILIDEAHYYAPEGGKSVATDPVAILASAGRKRGFLTICATQRLGKFNKDVAAELKNVLIGLTFIDVDQDRAIVNLGISKSAQPEFRRQAKFLEPGQFWALGIAIAREPTLIRIGPVLTTHPEPGQLSAPPPATPAKIRAVLAQLADLPQEAERQAKSETEWRAQVKRLEGELAVAKRAVPAAAIKTVEKSVLSPKDLQHIEKMATKLDAHQDQFAQWWNESLGKFEQQRDRLAQAQQVIVSELGNLRTALRPAAAPVQKTPVAMGSARPEPMKPPTPHPGSPRWVENTDFRSNIDTDGELPKGERTILIALAQRPIGVTRDQLSAFAGYKRSTRDLYLQKLERRGYIQAGGGSIIATPEGVAALGTFEKLPTGDALRMHWLARLPGGERAVLEVVAEVWPGVVAREAVSAATGYQRSTRDLYLQKLVRRRLVEQRDGGIRACAELFDDGGK